MRTELFRHQLLQFPNDAKIHIKGVVFDKDGGYEIKTWEIKMSDLEYIKNPDYDIENSINIIGYKNT
jgi:hypothetical protein